MGYAHFFFAHALACAWVPKPKVLGQVRSGRSIARGEDSQLLGGATYRRNAASVLSLPRGGLLVGGLPRHVGAAGARPTLKADKRTACPLGWTGQSFMTVLEHRF